MNPFRSFARSLRPAGLAVAVSATAATAAAQTPAPPVALPPAVAAPVQTPAVVVPSPAAQVPGVVTSVPAVVTPVPGPVIVESVPPGAELQTLPPGTLTLPTVPDLNPDGTPVESDVQGPGGGAAGQGASTGAAGPGRAVGSGSQQAGPPAPTGPRWQTPAPRPGIFAVPPTGPGYYSLFDALEGNERKGPPKYPYARFALQPPSFFDINWRYLDDPKNTDHDYFDFLKRRRIGDNWIFTAGGDVWSRTMWEQNSRLTGRFNDYNLVRTRAYADFWYDDVFRLYGEFIYADSLGPNLNPLPIDVNRSDFQNLFFDLKVFEFGEKDNPVYLRVGRQELLYGSQRLISTLDWANTRRTFQGIKGFTRTAKTDFDVFAVQPMRISRNELDSVDNNQIFSGAWLTHRPKQGQAIDLYYLNLDNTNPGAATGRFGATGAFNVSTVGTRYAGNEGNFLFDAEGMVQFGSWSNQSHFAQAFSVGGGYQFKDCPWNPQFWAYYDYASGDPDPRNTGTHRTFNQLFPFGHYYMGYLDLVGRQNINDINFQAVAYPTKWITLLTQYHIFRLAADKDALYGAAGQVLRRDPTGRAGNDVGNELDLLVNFHLSNHQDLLFGYSRLFAGDFIKRTGPGNDPELYYLQYIYRW